MNTTVMNTTLNDMQFLNSIPFYKASMIDGLKLKCSQAKVHTLIGSVYCKNDVSSHTAQKL